MYQVHNSYCNITQKNCRLALTLGDPAGMDQSDFESFGRLRVTQNCDITVIGGQSQLNEAYTQLVQKSIVMQLVSWHLWQIGRAINSRRLDWEAARQITTGTGMLLAALLTCLPGNDRTL